MLPKNFNEPMGAPAIFEKQIEIKLLHPASTLESRIQVEVFGRRHKRPLVIMPFRQIPKDVLTGAAPDILGQTYSRPPRHRYFTSRYSSIP
ncbi:MAG: hypothetical protein P8X89_17305 [Reinekea sp.]